MTFAGEADVRRLNRRWFGRRGGTDVMAFPAGEDFRGDVILSLAAARRQARSLGHALAAEIAILAAHGTLHLLGEEDRTPAGRRRMERLVERALA